MRLFGPFSVDSLNAEQAQRQRSDGAIYTDLLKSAMSGRVLGVDSGWRPLWSTTLLGCDRCLLVLKAVLGAW